MPMADRWTLRDRDRNLVVQHDGGQVNAEVNGRSVAQATVRGLSDATLALGTVEDVEQSVRVTVGLGGRPRRADLVEKDFAAAIRRPMVMSFVPPSGTKARRRYEFREAHPRLYATRHVVFEVLAAII